jgi:hypothetical protein
MGNKHKKQDFAAATPPAKTSGGFNPLVIGAAIIVVVGVGALTLRGGSNDADAVDALSPAGAASTDAAAPPVQTPQADARAIARAEAAARLGPRKHTNLPAIPFQGYAPPRSPEVITAAYRFAADHPEILSYVPCFCGCERSGHAGNADCFVKQRAENGDVVAWDEHGVECAVCIDVANRSRQMFESGASVRDIRAAIDKEFGAASPSRMGTPHPPGAHGGH